MPHHCQKHRVPRQYTCTGLIQGMDNPKCMHRSNPQSFPHPSQCRDLPRTHSASPQFLLPKNSYQQEIWQKHSTDCSFCVPFLCAVYVSYCEYHTHWPKSPTEMSAAPFCQDNLPGVVPKNPETPDCPMPCQPHRSRVQQEQQTARTNH